MGSTTMALPYNRAGFITVTDFRTDAQVTINLRHVNVIRPNDKGGTYIGINNSGALGFNVVEDYDTVLGRVSIATQKEN